MEKIKKYLDKHSSAIGLLFSKAQKTNTQTYYHQLRIEIKKLRALIDLIGHFDKKFKPNKALKPFHKIFESAGKIRELQLEESQMKKHYSATTFTAYKLILKEQKVKHHEAFSELIKGSLIEKQKKTINELKKSIKKIDEQKVEKYLHKKSQQINKLTALGVEDIADLHKLRKLIKTYSYNLKLIDQTDKEPILPLYSNLPELIGQWHDTQTMLKHLNKIIKVYQISKRELNQLNKVMDQISTRSKELNEQIKSSIQKLKPPQPEADPN
ncbi:MAG: CHAD domain-containing protein [Saprospiraceae bacterium]|nr:CHAD domain-containing protein [Candidatus Vicinibacter affinis]